MYCAAITLCYKINLGGFRLGSAPEAPPGGWFPGVNPVLVAIIYRVIAAQYMKHYYYYCALLLLLLLPLRITITITIAITIAHYYYYY